MQNIDERNKRGNEPRKHEDVLGHYLEKYEATKTVPDEEVGHSVPITKKDLVELVKGAPDVIRALALQLHHRLSQRIFH